MANEILIWRVDRGRDPGERNVRAVFLYPIEARDRIQTADGAEIPLTPAAELPAEVLDLALLKPAETTALDEGAAVFVVPARVPIAAGTSLAEIQARLRELYAVLGPQRKTDREDTYRYTGRRIDAAGGA